MDTCQASQGIPLNAGKGYQSQKNDGFLEKRKLKNNILKKAKKNKPLSDCEEKFNKIIGKTRFKVEGTFDSIKRWFNGGTARYRGQAKSPQKSNGGDVLQSLPKPRNC